MEGVGLMMWEGRTRRQKGEWEIGTLEEIDVFAVITYDNGLYSFHVYDLDKNGELGEDKNNLHEWVKSLGWAKRKCWELVANPIRDFKWVQID